VRGKTMTDQKNVDVIIIGAGPGGYVAAIRAAQLGLQVALVEKNTTLGGTCLNIGCIPSKALLDISEEYYKISQELPERGVTCEGIRLDLAKVMSRKQAVVSDLTSGISRLMKENGVEVIIGTGSIVDPNSVEVKRENGATVSIGGKNIVLASGSVPVELNPLPFDGQSIVSSTEALAFDQVPPRLIVIGAGAIGLELGSVWARFGSKVTVIELLPQILPGSELRLAKMLRKSLADQGMTFHLETSVKGFERTGDGITIHAVDAKNKPVEVTGDKILVSVGRTTFTRNLGIDRIGLTLTDRGHKIQVNNRFQTSIPTIYAIGDLIAGPMLAHKAEDEGVAVAECLAGKSGHVNYETIPNVVYTWPEVASVGLSEEKLKELGIDYKSGMFNFRANGRALCMGVNEGFVKILADAGTDAILGAHIMGPWASDLISEVVTVMEFGGSAEDIARTIHAHPTLSETVREAAMAVDGWSIHSSPPRKQR
jgi:dihydrolipoamide dehydrogenase